MFHVDTIVSVQMSSSCLWWPRMQSLMYQSTILAYRLSLHCFTRMQNDLYAVCIFVVSVSNYCQMTLHKNRYANNERTIAGEAIEKCQRVIDFIIPLNTSLCIRSGKCGAQLNDGLMDYGIQFHTTLTPRIIYALLIAALNRLCN